LECGDSSPLLFLKRKTKNKSGDESPYSKRMTEEKQKAVMNHRTPKEKQTI